jgi:hypothetical protein
MMKRNFALMLAAAALACGCEAKIGSDEGNVASAGNASSGPASAEGKAEEGKIAFSAPGFDLKVQLPLDEAAADSESRILYPGSKLTGIYVAAHPDKGSNGSVELRFATPDPPDKVAAWYRDPARAGDFALGAAAKDGAAWSIAGEAKEDGHDFRVRLEPKGTGTDGRLTVRDTR